MNVRVGDPFSSHEAVSVAPLVTPIVVCGTALWSMVRPGFCAEGELSPFHTTLDTLATAGFRAPLILAPRKNRRLMAKLLLNTQVAASALCLAEGTSHNARALRDTAAEMAVTDPDAVLLILPDDMSVVSRPGLEQAMALALPAARNGQIVCFGLDGTRQATNHSWLQAAEDLQILSNVQSVEAMSGTANASNPHGNAGWFRNAGIYLVSAQTLASLNEVNGRVDTMLLAPVDRLAMVKLDAGWSKVTAGPDVGTSLMSFGEIVAEAKDLKSAA